MGDCPDPASLQRRFFETIDSYSNRPPERAMLRVLLDCALQGEKLFRVGRRTIAASVVDHVAWRLYGRAGHDGVVAGFKVDTLAADARLDEQTYRRALAVLQRLHVLDPTRESRRRPVRYRLTVGTLDWPTACELASTGREPGLNNHHPSAGLEPGLSVGSEPGLKGYTEGNQKRTSEGASSTDRSLSGTARDPPAGDFGVEGMYWDDEGER